MLPQKSTPKIAAVFQLPLTVLANGSVCRPIYIHYTLQCRPLCTAATGRAVAARQSTTYRSKNSVSHKFSWNNCTVKFPQNASLKGEGGRKTCTERWGHRNCSPNNCTVSPPMLLYINIGTLDSRVTFACIMQYKYITVVVYRTAVMRSLTGKRFQWLFQSATSLLATSWMWKQLLENVDVRNWNGMTPLWATSCRSARET